MLAGLLAFITQVKAFLSFGKSAQLLLKKLKAKKRKPKRKGRKQRLI